MLIFTDAGYKEGVSSHGFIVKHWDGRVILRKSFASNEPDSTKSEMVSIENALNWIGNKHRGTKRQPRIYTDSLFVYEQVYEIKDRGIDVSYIQHMLKQLNVKLFWRRRRHVHQAHKLAKVQMKAKFNYIKNEESKTKYKCEGSSRFKVGGKKKGKYKNKRGV